jgi:hypothetical protein
MSSFFFIDYLVSFFILLAIDAPGWAWAIYAVSAVVWFVIWSICDSGANGKATDTSKQEQP